MSDYSDQIFVTDDISIPREDWEDWQAGRMNLRIPKEGDLSEFPSLPSRQVLKAFFDKEGNKTGEIRLEMGADGIWLLFDADCKDALPFCRAHCCRLVGILLNEEELQSIAYPAQPLPDGNWEMKKDSNSTCVCLDSEKSACKIYPDRPKTCQDFHCTRGPGMRGWKLGNLIYRQSAK